MIRKNIFFLFFIIYIMSIYKRYTDFIKNTQLKLKPDEWNFKNCDDYTYMLEHVQKQEGDEYLKEIKDKFKAFYEKNLIIQILWIVVQLI